MGFNEDIIERTERNAWFREVVATGPHAQVVVMSIPPGGEIGEEVHEDVDQVLTFVSGWGTAIMAGESSHVAAGHLVLVPGRHPPQHRQRRAGGPEAVHDLRAAAARPGDHPPDQGRGRRRRARHPGPGAPTLS